MRTIDVFATVKDSSKSVLDYEVAQDISLLDDYIKREYSVGGIISPSEILKQANQIYEGGATSSYKFPEKETYENVKQRPCGSLRFHNIEILKIYRDYILSKLLEAVNAFCRYTNELSSIMHLKEIRLEDELEDI